MADDATCRLADQSSDWRKPSLLTPASWPVGRWPVAARASTARPISIGSYNIHSCVGLDRRCRPQRIAAVMKELACDIYALQEVDNEPDDDDDSKQLEYLSAELGMAAIPGLRIVRHSGQYGNAILTHLPIVSVHRLDLSYPWFEPRGALDVRLDGGAAVLRVIATHLGLSRAERRAQWRQLLTAVATASPALPTIVRRRHERMVSLVDDAARCASHSRAADRRAGRVPDLRAFSRADAHLGPAGERYLVHRSASHAGRASCIGSSAAEDGH